MCKETIFPMWFVCWVKKSGIHESVTLFYPLPLPSIHSLISFITELNVSSFHWPSIELLQFPENLATLHRPKLLSCSNILSLMLFPSTVHGTQRRGRKHYTSTAFTLIQFVYVTVKKFRLFWSLCGFEVILDLQVYSEPAFFRSALVLKISGENTQLWPRHLLLLNCFVYQL